MSRPFPDPYERLHRHQTREISITLGPLLNAPLVVQVHAFAAMAAFGLGIVQLAAPKGTLPHRTLGWVWVVLMAVIAGSSFWIHGHGFRLWREFGPIHVLSVFSLVMLVVGIVSARKHNVRSHKITMISIFAGALVIAGLFTFVPGRIMHDVAFGRTSAK